MLSKEQIKKAEDHYNAKYVGKYDIMSGLMADVFYVENPDTSLGHSNYFGLYVSPKYGGLAICNAINVSEKEYPAIELEDGSFLVSRGRHDYVSDGKAFLDGGSEYYRYNPNYPPTYIMKIINGKEVFKKHAEPT